MNISKVKCGFHKHFTFKMFIIIMLKKQICKSNLPEPFSCICVHLGFYQYTNPSEKIKYGNS